MGAAKAKARLMAELIRSPYWLIITNKSSGACFNGISPDEFTDYMALQAQTQEIRQFKNGLIKLEREHKAALRKLEQDMDIKPAVGRQ